MAENGNGALTVQIDPTTELPSRYLGSDEDGPHYGAMTLYDAIAEAAAAKLLKLVEKDLRKSLGERITAKVDELVEAEQTKEPTVWIEVQHCRIESGERIESAREVVVGSDHGDFSWGVWDDEATANHEADRLRMMFEVVTP